MAADRTTVDAFYEAGVTAEGGKCNGKPGVREQYSSSYYAASVLDPVGNNIEVVYQAPLYRYPLACVSVAGTQRPRFYASKAG